MNIRNLCDKDTIAKCSDLESITEKEAIIMKRWAQEHTDGKDLQMILLWIKNKLRKE